MTVYQEYGNLTAPMIVFLHGGGVGGWMWDHQIKHFTDYHCVVPELIDYDREDFTIESCADRLLDLIESKGHGKIVTVVGFSLGAQVLVSMLGKDEGLIRHAVVNSALVGGMPLADILLKMSRLALPLARQKWFSRIQAKSMYIDERHYEKYYRETNRMSPAIFTRMMQENMSFTIPERFQHNTARILVTVGQKENGMMKKSMHDILSRNPNCTGCILPRVGHGISLANPGLFNEIVERWIHQEQLPVQTI